MRETPDLFSDTDVAEPEPAAAPAPAPVAAGPTWPPALVDTEMAIDSLREALVQKTGAGPAFQFLRTLAPFDRELLAEEPREIVFPALLGREIVARRYGLFLLLQKPAGPVTVDEEALRAVEKALGATLDAVQVVVQKLMAARDNAGTKEASAAHAVLSRALGDVRTLAKRLQNQVVTNAPLDGDGHRVATFEMQSAKVVEAPKAAEPKFQRHDLERSNPWPLRIAGLVLILALGAFVVQRNLAPPGPESWDAKRLATLANVQRVLVKEKQAVVTVNAAWKPDPTVLTTLQQKLREAGLERVVVVNDGGKALATGTTAGGLFLVEKKVRVR